MRVVVRLSGAEQSELVERLRGQTAELPVELIVDNGKPLEKELSAQFSAAEALATNRSARVVVWLDARPRQSGKADAPARIYVYISQPDAGRVFVRMVEGRRTRGAAFQPSEGAQLDSAGLESAAMVVRTALRALSEGAEIGVHRAEAERESEPRPQPRPPAPRVAEAPARPAKAHAVGWVAGISWQRSMDGLSSGQSGFAGRLGAILARQIELGVHASASFPADASDDFATVQISQRSIGAYAGWRLELSRSLRAAAGARVGAMGFWRTTVARQANVVPADSKVIASLLLGPELRFEWLPHLADGRVGIGAGLGMDYVPGAPLLEYEVRGSGVSPPSRQVSRLQPIGWVGLVVLSP